MEAERSPEGVRGSDRVEPFAGRRKMEQIEMAQFGEDEVDEAVREPFPLHLVERTERWTWHH